MKLYPWMTLLIIFLLAACTPVDLNAPVPTYNTGIDPQSWVTIPAGEFLAGQFNEPTNIDYDYEIMLTDVTVAQYVDFLNAALADSTLSIVEASNTNLVESSLTVEGEQVVGFYPGDEFQGVKHEEQVLPSDYIYVPLNDPASRFNFDGTTFQAAAGYENHPMTNVSWFGAWGYCGYMDYRLPTELEWEKAARGSEDSRPFPWGEEITRSHANYYASRDPFEDMSSFGSWTTPVGFYNGQAYGGYQTEDSASPYGLYDMAGNVWQWTGDVHEGQHYRYLRGGSKDTYEMDLRLWVRNNATPTYFSPGVGFRCVRGGE